MAVIQFTTHPIVMKTFKVIACSKAQHGEVMARFMDNAKYAWLQDVALRTRGGDMSLSGFFAYHECKALWDATFQPLFDAKMVEFAEEIESKPKIRRIRV